MSKLIFLGFFLFVWYNGVGDNYYNTNWVMLTLIFFNVFSNRYAVTFFYTKPSKLISLSHLTQILKKQTKKTHSSKSSFFSLCLSLSLNHTTQKHKHNQKIRYHFIQKKNPIVIIMKTIDFFCASQASTAVSLPTADQPSSAAIDRHNPIISDHGRKSFTSRTFPNPPCSSQYSPINPLPYHHLHAAASAAGTPNVAADQIGSGGSATLKGQNKKKTNGKKSSSIIRTDIARFVFLHLHFLSFSYFYYFYYYWVLYNLFWPYLYIIIIIIEWSK